MIQTLECSLYKILCSWWQHYKFTIQSREILSDTSYFSIVNETPAFFVSLYHHHRLGIVTWPTANPDSSFEEREIGFKELMDHIEKVSKELGLYLLITGTINENLVHRFERNGFTKDDEGVIHLHKEILCRQL